MTSDKCETTSRKNRRTVNLTQGVWDLVMGEAQIDYPGETQQMSMVTRVLLREAINARRAKRGEKAITIAEMPRRK